MDSAQADMQRTDQWHKTQPSVAVAVLKVGLP